MKISNPWSFLGKHIWWQVSIASIANNRHNNTLFQFLSQFYSCRHRPSTAHACEYCLLSCQSYHHLFSLLLRHIDNFINPTSVKEFWQISRRPSSDTWNLSILIRLYSNDLYFRVLFLQVHTGTHDRASGSHGRNEMSNCSLSVSVNLWACGFVMRVVIVRICKLIEHFVSALCNFLLSIVSRTFDTFCGWGQNNLCTIRLHCLDSLLCWIFRHDKLDIQIKHSSNHRQSNSSIATGWFNQFHSWLYLSSCQGLLYHVKGRSVLDTSTWILALQFGENSHIWVPENVSNLNQWRIANYVLDIVSNLWRNLVANFNLGSVEYFRVGWNWFGQPNITADDTVMPDNCLATQNCCPCVNCDIIFDPWMSDFILKDLFDCQCPESNSLVNFDVIANKCSLTNDGACSMVDRETPSNFSTRVNINSCFIMGTLRNESWNHWDSQFMEFVCHSVVRQSGKTRISSDDFDLVSCSRIGI